MAQEITDLSAAPTGSTKAQSSAERRILLTGVSCVGKTMVGARLATLLKWPFFDLDNEIEIFFGASIERLRQRFLTPYSFRKEAAKALCHVLAASNGRSAVIAMPPSGLMDAYWRVLKVAQPLIVVLDDEPENILRRVTFYDVDSKRIHKSLTDREEQYYLRDIRADVSYFERTYRRAHVRFAVAGLDPDAAAAKLKALLDQAIMTDQHHRQASNTDLRV